MDIFLDHKEILHHTKISYDVFLHTIGLIYWDPYEMAQNCVCI